jgi:hypothetical protein
MKNLKRFRLLVCQADDLPAVDLLVPWNNNSLMYVWFLGHISQSTSIRVRY